jgi:chemotaxis response regulator CheB
MLKEFVTHLSEYLDQRSRFRVLPLTETIRPNTGACYISANDAEHNEFDKFLTSLDKTDVTVVLLSGACIGNVNHLREIRNEGARILVQKPSLCMVPEPIESVIRAGIADKELSTADIIAEIF